MRAWRLSVNIHLVYSIYFLFTQVVDDPAAAAPVPHAHYVFVANASFAGQSQELEHPVVSNALTLAAIWYSDESRFSCSLFWSCEAASAEV
jgi:hypothetical protein